tara:strand:+ start:81 stop:998 length:918 start_codon:yes stop_codon:yes gene_type:complete
MIAKHETFNGTWPFKAKFTTNAGFKQHYIDEGSLDAEVLICLHGQPTWGYVYRKMVPYLSKYYRVIVPDHMGFGKSATPQNRTYTLESHVTNLAYLIEDLKLRNITFIAQDWGGPIAGAYALTFPKNVVRFCLMNTLLGYSGRLPNQKLTPWFYWIKKHQSEGTLTGVLGELGSSVLSIMQLLGFERLSVVDQNWIKAYSAAFPDRKSCIGAINFPLDISLGHCKDYIIKTLKLGNLSQIKQKPAMLIEGMKDRAIHPENAIADFKRLWPDGPIIELDDAGHFCQEDCPETLVALIHQFIYLTRT